MINYRGTPLFGEDSSVSHTSEFFAIAGTVLFWLLFLIFSLVIKPQTKKQYKEVQIVLSSTPVVQKTEEAPAPAEQAAASAASAEPQIVETPAVEPPAAKVEPVKETEAPSQKTPAPKKAETPKTAAKKEPAKTQTQPKTETPVQYGKTVEQLIEEQFNKKTTEDKMNNFDKMFGNDEDDESSLSKENKIVQNNTPAISGTAGTAADKGNIGLTSSQNIDNNKNQTVTGKTTDALKAIRNTFTGTATHGVQTETTAKTKTSGSGRVELEMTNGRYRALINPSKPIINLSDPASATVDISVEVEISFKVLESGNVTEIKITPESLLSPIVKQEIINQIKTWQFEPADYVAKAILPHKIVKK